jgi:hypothetical protein
VAVADKNKVAVADKNKVAVTQMSKVADMPMSKEGDIQKKAILKTTVMRGIQKRVVEIAQVQKKEAILESILTKQKWEIMERKMSTTIQNLLTVFQ